MIKLQHPEENDDFNLDTLCIWNLSTADIYSLFLNLCIYWGRYKDGCCRSKERIRIYFKIGISTKRFVFLNLFILFLHTCYIYICMFSTCCFHQRTCVAQCLLMGYSMRLELTLVNDHWLVKLVYIGVIVPLFWSVFTLLGFTHLWYLICL